MAIMATHTPRWCCSSPPFLVPRHCTSMCRSLDQDVDLSGQHPDQECQWSQLLTAGQRTMLRTDPAPKAWFDTNFLGTLVANTIDPDGGKVTGSGTITWTHNPAGGRTYTIVTQSAGGRFHWRWALNFPMDITTFSCPNPPTATPASYTGFMEVTPSLIKMKPARGDHRHPGDVRGHGKITLIGSPTVSLSCLLKIRSSNRH